MTNSEGAANNKNLWQRIQSLHKWLGLLVGLQLLIWLATGLAFNSIDGRYLDANHYRIKSVPEVITTPLASLEPLLEGTFGKNVQQLRLTSVLGRPVYELSIMNQQIHRYWADTLEPFSLGLEQIATIAKQSYSGHGHLGQVQILNDGSAFEVEGNIAVIATDDEIRTRIYIDPTSGKVLGHKNNFSDVSDFLFMLHFMDYRPSNGITFNHLLVQLVAIIALLLGMSGSLSLWHKYRQGQLSIRSLFTRKHGGIIKVYALESKLLIGQFPVGNTSLLEAINDDKPWVMSHCGGGGRCGLCKLRFKDNPPAPNDYDLDKLSQQELDLGIRLSCQHPSTACEVMLISAAQQRYWQRNHNI
ncbi:PepSY domain-containing protein [Shewanella acanthi]|uniref:PepSY domain-containing protein n=1 Tax=Shewanella acanthi TaxID=2864212 RepID=UPI001C6615E2|nr:PepSY domain-containing protein [Shewanella acanthi]QYJ78546.1 PepSY domain-containing protein [Shewanella acanthi]